MKTTFYKSFILILICVSVMKVSQAQFAFTEASLGLATPTHSGCAVTVVDVNNDGLDDMLIMDQSTDLVLRLQNKNGTYSTYLLGQIQGSKVWGMAAAD